MFQLLFKSSLGDSKYIRHLLWYIRKIVIKLTDPIVKYNLNGVEIRLNWSHDLPYYRLWFPLYSENLARLSQFIANFFGRLSLIDVGANVGDSYALTQQPNSQYLLIEGDSAYFDQLKTNVSRYAGVVCAQHFLAEQSQLAPVSYVAEKGSGQLVATSKSSTTNRALDDVLSDYPTFLACNLLKIDVDGYDLKVLRGAFDLLKSASPTLFFEYDPKLLLSESDPTLIFHQLAELGYTDWIIYDNVGYMVEVISAENPQQLKDLTIYAQQKTGYYFDIVSFHKTHHKAQSQFLAMERRFYG